MYILLTILIVIAAVLLTLLVIVQNSKGGGLAAGFSSGNQVMGAPKTADFLEKATWVLAVVILALCVLATAFIPSHTQKSSAVLEKLEQTGAPAAQPEFPVIPADSTQN